MLNLFKMFHMKLYFGLDELPASGGSAPETPAPVVTTPETPATPVTPDISTLKPDEIKTLLEKSTPAPTPTEDPNDRSKWFDPTRGFRTKEDADKSYHELMESNRQKAEKLKEYEQKEALYAQEQERLRIESTQRTLTEEEQKKQAALAKWKSENQDALNFIKEEIKRDMTQETQAEQFQKAVLESRRQWKEQFDKEDSRKVLWPVMEEIYKEKGNVFEDFGKNPLPYIEAVAFQKNFGTIAERIKAEAVEQYKASIRQAHEAERRGITTIPGGPKTTSGELDTAAMSSKELSTLLPRNENG